MSIDNGYMGGFGKPGVRVGEKTGGKAAEFDLPLLHALVIGILLAVGVCVVLPLELALIGRGLLLAGFVAALVWGVWRLAQASDSLLYRVALVMLGGAALLLWLEFGQPYVERLWIPVWYGLPTTDGFAPVQFGNDPLRMRLLPGWVLVVRLLAIPGVALAYCVPAMLVLQRFGMEIVLPQFLSVVPNPVPVRTHVPRWFPHLEQDFGEEDAAEPAAGPQILVEWPDLEPREQEIGNGVTTSNGMGNHGRRTALPVLSLDKWDALAAYVLTGRSWSEDNVARGNILTKDEYRLLTKALLECHYLTRREGSSRGYAWTAEGLAFLRHRLWRHYTTTPPRIASVQPSRGAQDGQTDGQTE